MRFSFIAFVFLISAADAYTFNRRAALKGVVASVGGASLVELGFVPEPAHAVISGKYCAYGSGDGCEDLAEGNELIKQLQAKSAANKEANLSVS